MARLDFPVPPHPNPGAVAFGDFNADGKTDLAISGTPNSVSVLFGNGDGTLQPAVSYTVGSTPVAIAVGDFNGDGKLDIVTANSADNSISVLLNQGTGTFQLAPVTNLVIGQAPNSLAVGDFNGDGKLDVAVVVALPQVGANAVEVFLGKGDGTFQPGVNSPADNGVTGLAIADMNGDGKLDFVTVDATGAAVFLGNGDGTFQSPAHFPAGNNPHSLVLGDFNNDGKIDAAVADSELQSFSVLLGNGDGTFQPTIQSTQGGLHVEMLVAGDFNGDGRLDLISEQQGFATVLLGNGDGTFQRLPVFVTASAGVLAAADMDGNGKLDLVSLSPQSFVSVLLGIGDGTFQTAKGVGLQASVARSVATDLNGDGNIDLVASATASATGGANGGEVQVLLGNGIGAFGTPQVTALPFGADATGGLAVGDLNKDGKPDVVIGNSAGSVSILLGNGDGSFQPPVDYTSGIFPAEMAVADFNGDGNSDIVFANSSASISILLGKGDGTFGFPTTVVSGSGIFSSLGLGDFNNDGKPDLAMVSLPDPNSNAMTLSVLLGNGDGTFQSPINTPLPSQGTIRSSMAVADFNKDGNLDIAVANETFLLELLGDGHGGFSVIQLLSDTANIPYTSVVAADLNGDGNIDIAVGDKFLQHILVLLANGSGSFGAPSYFGTNVNPGSTAVADLNGDGRPDLIATSGGIDLLFSRGSGPATAGAVTSPASLDFGNQDANSPGSPQTITLKNNGTLTLTIKSISITGTNSADFGQQSSCGATLPVGSSCRIDITFDPAVAGSRSAMVSITDSAPNSPQTVALSGNGQDIQITVSPAANTVTAGQTANYSLSLSPMGGFSQNLSLTCSGAPAASTCTVSPSSVSFSGNTPASATVTVTTTGPSFVLPENIRPRFWPFVTFLPALALLMFTLLSFVQELTALQQSYSRKLLGAVAGLLACLVFMTASCGGGGAHLNPGTPSGTFNLTVTATSGTFTRSTKLVLAVN